MESAGRRPLLISKGWVQVVILVILLGLLRPRAARLPDVHGEAAGAAAHGRRARSRALHRPTTSPRASRCSCTTGSWSTGRSSGTARTSARTSPRTTCGGRRTSSSGSTAAPARTPPRSRTIDGLPHQPLRRAERDDDGEPRAGGGVRHARALLQPLLLGPRLRRTACARRRSPNPTQLRQLTAFFAWTAWAASTDRPGARLLVHEQLAAGAARRELADGERPRLVDALAHRAADRRRACCSPRSGAGARGWAGTAASRRR